VPAPASVEQVKIGLVTSLTGLVPAHNQELVNGFNLYLEQVHHKVGNRQIELLVRDDESKPHKAVEIVRDLVQKQKVSILAGVFFAPIAYKVAPVVNSLQTPLLITLSGADDLTQRTRYPWIMRIARTSSQPMHALGDYAAKHLKYKRAVIISTGQPYGYESAGGFHRTFEESGGQIVQRMWLPFDMSDYSEPISKIKKDADAVFVVLSNGKQAEFIRQYHKSGPKIPLLSNEQTLSESTLAAVGEDASGSVCSAAYIPTLNGERNKQFRAAYRKTFGAEPGVFAVNGFNTAKWIHKALASYSGKIDHNLQFLQALRRVVIDDAPQGTLRMDQYGQVVQDIYICKTEKVDNKVQNTVIYKYPNVSQFWTYEPNTYLRQPLYSATYPICTHCD